MSLFIQYSYPIFSVIILGAAFLVMRRLHIQRRVLGLIQIGIAVVLIAVFFILRPGFSDVDSAQAAEALINNGRPTFMEFFSNYCSGCLSMKPTVDGLVSDLEADYNILRVDIHTTTGRELREKLGFSYTPEFILFDDAGQEIWRGHNPPPDNQLQIALPASS